MARLFLLFIILLWLSGCKQPSAEHIRVPDHIDSLVNNRQVEDFVNSQLHQSDSFVLMPRYLSMIDRVVFREFASGFHFYDSFSMPLVKLQPLYERQYTYNITGPFKSVFRRDLAEHITVSSESYRRFCDSIKMPMVAKGDFDNNGTTDLLVAGKLGYEDVQLCILCKGGNRYQVVNFDNVLYDKIVQIVPFSGATDELILYNTLYLPEAMREQEFEDKIDTLMYYDTFFIERGSPHHPYDIEEIQFTDKGGLVGGCWSLRVKQNGEAKFVNRLTRYVEPSSKYPYELTQITDSIFIGTIDSVVVKYLYNLLNVSDLPTLRDSYRVRGSDYSTGYLSITYNGGKVKQVKDYGMMGTFALRKVYEVINTIHHSTQWHYSHLEHVKSPDD